MASNSTQENNSWRIFGTIRNLASTVTNKATKVADTIKNGASAAGSKWQETSTVTKACIVGGTAVVLAPLAVIPVLGAAGFTSAGVAAGSLAASMQTATTASGSIFALCQAAGATGVVATSTSVGVGAAAGVTAGGLTAVVCKKKACGKQSSEEEQDEGEEDKDTELEHDQPCDPSEEKVQYKLHLILSEL